jgi:conjugal transfer pilus assembly protein TraI
LLDGSDIEAPSVIDPATPTESTAPPAPVISLRVPLRLNPPVRNALAEAVATLNGTAGGSDVCTVAEGIFVPLAEFQRRGIQPSIAIRALEETGMLRRASAGDPPTVLRQIRDESVIGLILAPRYVEGLDQSLFAPQHRKP